MLEKVSAREEIKKMMDKSVLAKVFVYLAAHQDVRNIPDKEKGLRSMILLNNCLVRSGIIKEYDRQWKNNEKTARKLNYRKEIFGLLPDDTEKKILKELKDHSPREIRGGFRDVRCILEFMYPELLNITGVPLFDRVREARLFELMKCIRSKARTLDDGGRTFFSFCDFARKTEMGLFLGLNENGTIRWIKTDFGRSGDKVYKETVILQTLYAIKEGIMIIDGKRVDTDVRYVMFLDVSGYEAEGDMGAGLIAEVDNGVLRPVYAEDLKENGVRLPYGLMYE